MFAAIGSLVRPGRDLRVDFIRGLSLWFIFIDHTPGNLLGRATLRNVAFCDATEAFVLLAGFALAAHKVVSHAKVGPALAAGNTLILKPAPDTPWAAAVLGELITEYTDFPAGTINIVTSRDHGVGALLSKHDDVDMVSFTGSTVTGRAVMTDAAAGIKKVFLELGGKSAFLVLDDADVAAACAMAAFTASMHAGQGCAITTRLVVPRARYDEAVAAAAGTMASLARVEKPLVCPVQPSQYLLLWMGGAFSEPRGLRRIAPSREPLGHIDIARVPVTSRIACSLLSQRCVPDPPAHTWEPA